MITFFGRIENGILNILNRGRFLGEISQLKDGFYELTIKRKNRRTSPQNRYYWGVVIWEIRNRLNELGNDFDPETVHDFLKDKFNAVPIVGDGGEIIGNVGGSTTEMNKSEFGEYLDKIILWAAEFLQLHIPPPNTQTEISL